MRKLCLAFLAHLKSSIWGSKKGEIDAKEVQKWLKKNFKDVYSRDGSALKKGDVLEYILKF